MDSKKAEAEARIAEIKSACEAFADRVKVLGNILVAKKEETFRCYDEQVGDFRSDVEEAILDAEMESDRKANNNNLVEIRFEVKDTKGIRNGGVIELTASFTLKTAEIR